PNPSRLVAIDQVYSLRGKEAFRAWSYPRFEDLRRLAGSFDSMTAFAATRLSLTGSGDPEQAAAETVSPAYFPVLRSNAAQGRVFSDDEDRTARPVAVISDRFWKRRFGSEPQVVGRTIRLNEIPFTVIGVMPSDFRGMASSTDIWVPMMMAPALANNPRRLTNANAYWHQVIGRLRDGV